MTKTRLFSLLLTVAMALSGAPAFAKIIFFDFNQPGDFPDGISFTNITSQGFTFSPNCHLHVGVFPFHSSPSMGFDTALGCGSPQGSNQNYLGPINQAPAVASIFVLYDGGPFSLTDVFAVTPSWSLTSSNGGFFDADLPRINVNFSGPQWTDVAWIEFSTSLDSQVAFDDLRLQVPEPATLTLLGVALAGLAFTRRRKQ